MYFIFKFKVIPLTKFIYKKYEEIKGLYLYKNLPTKEFRINLDILIT